MSTSTVLRSRFPRTVARGAKFVGSPVRFLDSVGHIAWFVVTAVGSIGHAFRYYRKEMLRLIAEIGMGTGAMAVIGGTVAIVGFVTLSGGSLIAIQGFASLGNIGVEAFTGSSPRSSTCASRPRCRPVSHWPQRSGPVRPRSWARCASARRSTPSR